MLETFLSRESPSLALSIMTPVSPWELLLRALVVFASCHSTMRDNAARGHMHSESDTLILFKRLQ